MREVPTTAEYLAVQAAASPTRRALREDGEELDYAQLHNHVAQCGLALQRLGVARGHRVAVSGPGFGIQLVLLLAAEALGAATLSFQADGDPDRDWIFANVDWVFSCLPQEVPQGVRFFRVDQAFARALAQPLEGEGPQWVALAAQEPQRIVRTSGSSGASKFMVLKRDAQEWWIRVALESPSGPMTPGTRCLVLGPLVINAAFARASSTLRLGGMLVVGSGGEIEALAPTHITGLPMHLERLLGELPAGWRAPQPVWVSVFGGTASPDLRARIAAVFGQPPRNGYGSNETAILCNDLDAAGTGVLRAGVDVRVLDEAGGERPAGGAGILAFRTPALVEAYLGRPQESAAALRDGWFVSGDLGALVGPRRLQLLGRHDDLVNVGGLKIPAARLEESLRAQPAIADAAVLAMNSGQGESTLGIAVVAKAGTSAEAAREQVPAALQLPAAVDARVLVLEALPRTQAGKTDRLRLLRLLRGPDHPVG